MSGNCATRQWTVMYIAVNRSLYRPLYSVKAIDIVCRRSRSVAIFNTLKHDRVSTYCNRLGKQAMIVNRYTLQKYEYIVVYLGYYAIY